MKIFKNNSWIDTSVYENWIENLNGCWIGIENISSEHTESAYIFKNEYFPNNSINTIEFIPNEDEYIAVMSWGVVGEEIAIVKLEVKEEYRGMGIGQFFVKIMWTWLIENNDKIVRAPYTFRSDIVEHITAKHSVEYNLPYAILKTTDGEYAKLEDTPLDKIWGIQNGVNNNV